MPTLNRCLKVSLLIKEKVFGPDHSDVALSLYNLGLLYQNQDRYAGCRVTSNKRSLAIREKALGTDHPDVAASLNNLAQLYRAQGRYAEAEPLYKRSLPIKGKSIWPRSFRCRVFR